MGKFDREPNCQCSICGVKMWVKPSRLRRQIHGVSCSKECGKILRSRYMTGEGNHQFGLTGELNSSYKHDEKINSAGYIMENVPGHPKGGKIRDRGKATYILKHRLIIERNYGKFPKELFENICGWIVLKDCYDVHHINEDKTDNRLENLEVLTRGEHTTIHNFEKTIIRDNKTGRIIGVLKQGELLENPEVGNQQPSMNSNVLEGSTTNSRVQTSKVEDSNADTSALPFKRK
jgi:hypothetical protein